MVRFAFLTLVNVSILVSLADVHGNRGKCAQGCRLPYTLFSNETPIDNGYLLSSRDLCSLELLPELVKAE